MRQPTPLEELNRNHNWRQGALQRLVANIQMIGDPADYALARQLVQNEINRTRTEFEKKKQELRSK